MVESPTTLPNGSISISEVPKNSEGLTIDRIKFLKILKNDFRLLSNLNYLPYKQKEEVSEEITSKAFCNAKALADDLVTVKSFSESYQNYS